MRRIVLTLALFAGTIHASEPQPSRQPKTLIEPSVPAQPPQPPIFRGGTNRVQIDAIVTDDNRSPVTDLRAADFELQDDGKPVPIDSVRFDNAGDLEQGRQLTLSHLRVGIVGTRYHLNLARRELQVLVTGEASPHVRRGARSG